MRDSISTPRRYRFRSLVATALTLAILSGSSFALAFGQSQFKLEEATIESVQKALLRGELTSVQLVQLHLERIKAYGGTCVSQPEGLLGLVIPVPNAGQTNALITLNLRPARRAALGFDARKARSMTDSVDSDPAMPDALEVAAQLDAYFRSTGKLIGPLHGIPCAIKDQFDTFDMRTTSGADAAYANDRPPQDATFVKRLREAGAIILAKSNMGEYAAGGTPGNRSSFGGTFCNPYDTTRSAGVSSGGSGAAVAANLVMFAIGEETGTSIRSPASNNSIVGIAGTQELVSRAGMMPASFANDRPGALARTVKDAAAVLDVISGYDPRDELTAFSVGRKPTQPYTSFANATSLEGVRIGVIREYMDKDLFTQADYQSIDIINKAIEDLRRLGATIVDPGEHGALFQDAIKKLNPYVDNALFISQFPALFPVDPAGAPTADHIKQLVDMYFDPALFPATLNIRGLGPATVSGQGKYMLNRYLRDRGDAKMKSIDDLLANSKFWVDSNFGGGPGPSLQNNNTAQTLNQVNRWARKYTTQQLVLQVMAEKRLDVLVYPTRNVPPHVLGQPAEPTVNGRSPIAWTTLPGFGFPAIAVPAGFTTQVFDRVRDAAAPGGTRLVGPLAAQLPVSIDFLGRPFDEPTLLKVASAYERATGHRRPPMAFPALR